MNLFLFLLIFILSPITITLNLTYSRYYIYLKALSSTCFLLCGIFSFVKSKTKRRYPILILLGLFSSLIGDIIINLSSIPNYFIIAFLFFAIAHVLFTISFTIICRIKFRNIIMFLALYSFFIYLTQKYNTIFNFKGLFPFIAIYAGLIIFMFIKSLDLLRYFKLHKFYTFISVLGPLLFLISDIILFFNEFSIFSCPILYCLNHLTYFPGQGLLALSLTKNITSKEKMR